MLVIVRGHVHNRNPLGHGTAPSLVLWPCRAVLAEQPEILSPRVVTQTSSQVGESLLLLLSGRREAEAAQERSHGWCVDSQREHRNHGHMQQHLWFVWRRRRGKGGCEM